MSRCLKAACPPLFQYSCRVQYSTFVVFIVKLNFDKISFQNNVHKIIPKSLMSNNYQFPFYWALCKSLNKNCKMYLVHSQEYSGIYSIVFMQMMMYHISIKLTQYCKKSFSACLRCKQTPC